jgi:hypothetical protein
MSDVEINKASDDEEAVTEKQSGNEVVFEQVLGTEESEEAEVTLARAEITGWKLIAVLSWWVEVQPLLN